MDATLVQILEACNLAKALEAELATLQNHPHYLLSSCERVVEAFHKAIESMRSLYPSPLAASAGLLYGGGEGSSRGGSRMQEVNILDTRALEGADNPFFGRGPEETTALGLPQLGLEIQMPGAMAPAAAATAELAGAPGYTGGPQTEVRPFRGRRAEAEGPPRQPRIPAGSPRRVRAVRTGNSVHPPDDGYTWRKYGQKNILGSRYPRSYFRCTHRNFYGCEAKKRVQLLDDDPYTYEVTYCGTHTCLTSTTPLLVPPLPLPTTIITTIATTTTATGPTVPFTSGGPSMGNPEGPTAASLAEAMMITGQAPPLSTSIQLGSWLTRGLEGGSSHSGPSHAQGGGGSRDAEWPVADLADAMFNSGSSGSSMDAIFPSTRQDNQNN
ncbi:WRKY transcription factor 55-like [Ananas comosus]|uniref:WRKY transcription factor 55-like n=1 Tax=Ananas comosus TaxID=4615 RepID=A0A6P5ESS6_ANACO|nr:WRKY transcription factor 55-like [Ananas comosus]